MIKQAGKGFKGMQKAAGAWLEAREAVRRLARITVAMKEKAEQGEIEELMSLLDERQEIYARLDKLREEAGIRSWTMPAEQCPQEAENCSAEITAALKQLIEDDKAVKDTLNARKIAVQEDIEEVRRSRRAQEKYRGSGAAGVFIDSRG